MTSKAEEIKKMIADLKDEEARIQTSIRYAEQLLASLTGEAVQGSDCSSSNIGFGKNKKLPEDTKRKMRISQQRRQERELKFKFEKIQKYVKDNAEVTVNEICDYMNLSAHVIKKYLRKENSHCEEIASDVWKYIG